MAVVYRHRRLDDFSIFYVGIGKEEKRAYTKDSRNDLWRNIVAKAGYEVEIVSTDIPYKQAKELEVFMISEYGRRDLGKGRLCNMTDGGEGCLGMIVSEETRAKSAYKISQYSLSGKFIKFFKSISEAGRVTGVSKGRIASTCKGEAKAAGGYIWKYKNSEDREGVKEWSSSATNKKPVLQLTLSGVLLNKFYSVSEAATHSNTTTGNISRVCSRKRKTTGGFQWRYENDNTLVTEIASNATKAVSQYTKDEVFIKDFISVTTAMKELNISHIGSVCSGKRKTAGGYKWKYKK